VSQPTSRRDDKSKINKIASIISKYACELGSINNNQAKAIVQAINGAKHTK